MTNRLEIVRGHARPPNQPRLEASLGLAALLALAVACTSSGKASTTIPATGAGGTGESTTAGSTGSGRQGSSPVAQFCVSGTVNATPAGLGTFSVESAHYQLDAEATLDEAVEMGRLLEAAYSAFGAWFRAAPPLAAGERLRVKLYADGGSFAHGLLADGIAVPMEAGGYYAPSTKTAYLFWQGNPYYSRVLLVHEATHQYHELARTRGQALPFWYTEGQAEYLSRHDWDGRCVRLGVTPVASWEDIAAHARLEATEAGIDVAAIVSGTGEASRPAAWALFRYLDTGARHAEFQTFRDVLDEGQRDPARSFAALVGDPAALSRPLAAWLSDVQEPLKPIFTEWIHVGPRAVIGSSPALFSLAIVKDALTHFEARYDVPAAAGGDAGVVIGYADEKNYQALVVSRDGTLRTFTSTAGSARWSDAGTSPAATAGEGALAVDFGAESMTVTVNGATAALKSGTIGALPAKAGLAVSDGRVSFHDVAWR